MSYGRIPYYIWSDGELLSLVGIDVPEKLINAFLYKILLTNRREKLKERLLEGKAQWENPEYKEYNRNLDIFEDEIMKSLMGIE